LGSFKKIYLLLSVQNNSANAKSDRFPLFVCRRDTALGELAVKPITQFPVSLDDEVSALLIYISIITLCVHTNNNYSSLFDSEQIGKRLIGALLVFKGAASCGLN